jgi:hypothetical protein
MQTVQPGIRFGFNYATYDQNDSLFVKATIYDITTGTPVLLRTTNMLDVSNGCYSGSTIALSGKTVLIIALVYTDGTYSTIDTTRAPWCDIYKSSDALDTFLAFNYAMFDQSSQFIAANIYNITSGTPVFVVQVPMTLIIGGVYFGYFNGIEVQNYEAIKIIYTDGTYVTPDTDYAPATDSLQVVPSSNSGNIVLAQLLLSMLQVAAGGPIGCVVNSNTVEGEIVC